MHGNPDFESVSLQCRIDHTIVVHIPYTTRQFQGNGCSDYWCFCPSRLAARHTPESPTAGVAQWPSFSRPTGDKRPISRPWAVAQTFTANHLAHTRSHGVYFILASCNSTSQSASQNRQRAQGSDSEHAKTRHKDAFTRSTRDGQDQECNGMARFGTGPKMQGGEAAAGRFLLCRYCPLIVLLYQSSGLHFLPSVLFCTQTYPIVTYC